MPTNLSKPSILDLPHIFRAAVELGCALAGAAATNAAAVDKSVAGARLDKAYDKLARALQIADDSETYFDQWFRLGEAAKCSKEQISALRRLTFAFWTLNGQARYQPAGKTKSKRRPASEGLRLLENGALQLWEEMSRLEKEASKHLLPKAKQAWGWRFDRKGNPAPFRGPPELVGTGWHFSRHYLPENGSAGTPPPGRKPKSRRGRPVLYPQSLEYAIELARDPHNNSLKIHKLCRQKFPGEKIPKNPDSFMQNVRRHILERTRT